MWIDLETVRDIFKCSGVQEAYHQYFFLDPQAVAINDNNQLK